jgi:hypothetical protein
VASTLDVIPIHAHELLLEFATEFKKIRDEYAGESTLKTFPSSSSDFTLLYPSILTIVVNCRVDHSGGIEKEIHPLPIQQQMHCCDQH